MRPFLLSCYSRRSTRISQDSCYSRCFRAYYSAITVPNSLLQRGKLVHGHTVVAMETLGGDMHGVASLRRDETESPGCDYSWY
jgi:hypothetical protein